MRLWHSSILPYLPMSQLTGQNRECLALLGKGWGRPHAAVNYVFRYDKLTLASYWLNVRNEMTIRALERTGNSHPALSRGYIEYYPEHDDIYLSFCLHNLKYGISASTGQPKGIDLFEHFGYISDQGYYDKLKEYEYLNKGAK